MRFSGSTIGFLLLSAINLFADEALNPKASDICNAYKAVEKTTEDIYRDRILQTCDAYTKEKLAEATRPAHNFRPLATCGAESSCSIYRSGQPAPKESSEEALKNFRKYHFGFSLAEGKKEYQIEYVVDLRYDHNYLTYADTFGKDMPTLPVSTGESIYSYPLEQKLIEEAGMKSVYAPTIPETEHLVSNFVPRFVKGENPKPYICRLPDLMSAFEDCHDLYEEHGKEKVEAWLLETKKVSHAANQIFIRIADFISALSKGGHKVWFHCSSGTDRVGRVSMILELRDFGVTREEIRAYKGPLSDPKIDLIVLDYLISQNAGNEPQFKYVFADLKTPEKSWLYMGLDEVDPSQKIPAMDRLQELREKILR